MKGSTLRRAASFGLGCPTLGCSQHLRREPARQGLRGPFAVEPSQQQGPL